MKNAKSRSEKFGYCEISKAKPFQKTIAIYDDNPLLADGIKQIFSRDTYLSDFSVTVGTHPKFTDLQIQKPDILIIDPAQYAEIHDILLEDFRSLAENISLVGYCSDISEVKLRALSRVGFRGLIPRTVDSEEFVRIVCAVAYGGIYLHESYTKKQVEPVKPQPSETDNFQDLTDREIEVLRNVALGSSMKEIANLLKISTKTVDTYRTRANRKLNLRSRSDIVRYAIESGWMH